MDINEFNTLLNHPSIKPYVLPGITDHYDGSQWFYSFVNVIYGDAHGGALFEYDAPGIYHGHYLFTPAIRGREALKLSREWLNDMFTNHGATDIFGLVPRGNRASQVMTRALGFSLVGTNELDRCGQPCFKYILTRR
jgi:hypothetical protein